MSKRDETDRQFKKNAHTVTTNNVYGFVSRLSAVEMRPRTREAKTLLIRIPEKGTDIISRVGNNG
jgi:hypothetical protein